MAATVTPTSITRGGERRLLLLAVVCGLLLVGLYVLMVRTGWGQRLDDDALDGRTTREVVVRATDRLLDTISITSLVASGGVIVLVAIARLRPHVAVVAVGVVGGANVTTQLLKRSLSRPDLAGGPDALGGPSFPSGHSTVAMSLAVALLLVVPARFRAVTAAAVLGYAALIGTGTVTAGWHRPSDVLGGYLVAIGWAALGALAVIVWRGAVPTRGQPRATAFLSPIVIGTAIALLLVGFVGFGVVIVAERQGRLDAVDLDEAYTAALVTIVGVGILLVSALVVALRRVDLDPTPDEERAGVAGS